MKVPVMNKMGCQRVQTHDLMSAYLAESKVLQALALRNSSIAEKGMVSDGVSSTGSSRAINSSSWSDITPSHLGMSGFREITQAYEELRALLLPQCFHGGRKRKRRPGGRRLSV